MAKARKVLLFRIIGAIDSAVDLFNRVDGYARMKPDSATLAIRFALE